MCATSYVSDNSTTPGHQFLVLLPSYLYRGADKSLARPDWKNNWKFAIFRPTLRSLLPRRPGWMDNLLNFGGGIAKVRVVYFLPGRAKDLSAPRYYFMWLCYGRYKKIISQEINKGRQFSVSLHWLLFKMTPPCTFRPVSKKNCMVGVLVRCGSKRIGGL